NWRKMTIAFGASLCRRTIRAKKFGSKLRQLRFPFAASSFSSYSSFWRAKDVSAGLLVGGRGVAVGDVHNAAVNGTADLSSCCGGSNKLPLLFKPNDCSSAGAINQRGRLLLVPTGAAPEKNETQAKLNNNYSDNCSPTRDPARTPPPPYDVIGLHKATTNLREAACNLYQPLLDHPPPTSPQAPQNLGLLHCSNVFEDSESWRPLAKRP
ncbi:unnamed protein product, partial [Nesidiocoris tenuis]